MKQIITLLMLLIPTMSFAQDELRWAADPTGGAPFVYKPPGAGDADPYIGFEVELAEYLARKLNRKSVMVDGQWSALLDLLDKPRKGSKGIDIVLNGYEDTPSNRTKAAATIPYYAYRISLIARTSDTALSSWAELRDSGDNVGVLTGSSAANYSKAYFGERRVLVSDDVENVMGMVQENRLRATIQDNTAAAHFTKKYPTLHTVGEGRQPGFYVIYLRKDDPELLEQLNTALRDGFRDGTLQRIYRKYDLWNLDQEWLAHNNTGEWPQPLDQEAITVEKGGGSLWKLIPQLLRAAGTTVFLSLVSFPIAMALGMALALGRVYGPWWLTLPLSWYVEAIRGTPLLLQLYVIFYMLPKLVPWLAFDPIVAGIIGLAINYSAYEAENYRAGLRAVPKGQMEAALALGMTQVQAIRRIIVPQAVRIVIPPVTNDFIALFKDTSVCSVILITELTRKYNELYNFNRDLVIELAVLTGGLYLMMSYPLAFLANRLEKRLK